MSKHYFKKEQVSNKVIGIGGVPLPFEVLPGNTGLLQLDDESPEDTNLVTLLDRVVGKQGVVRIDEGTYLELKKKRLSVTFAPRSSDMQPVIRVVNPIVPRKSSAAPEVEDAPPVASVAPSPEPLVMEPLASDVPAPLLVPRRGRPPKIKAPTMPVSMAPVREEVVRIAP